jgi:hypothetical protein
MLSALKVANTKARDKKYISRALNGVLKSEMVPDKYVPVVKKAHNVAVTVGYGRAGARTGAGLRLAGQRR